VEIMEREIAPDGIGVEDDAVDLLRELAEKLIEYISNKGFEITTREHRTTLAVCSARGAFLHRGAHALGKRHYLCDGKRGGA